MNRLVFFKDEALNLIKQDALKDVINQSFDPDREILDVLDKIAGLPFFEQEYVEPLTKYIKKKYDECFNLIFAAQENYKRKSRYVSWYQDKEFLRTIKLPET